MSHLQTPRKAGALALDVSPTMKNFTLIAKLSAVSIAVLLSACGGSDTAESGQGPIPPPIAVTPTILSGVMVGVEGGVVAGLDYGTSPSVSAPVATPLKSTDAAGKFSCLSNEVVTFSIGKVVLGSTTCKPLISLLDLSGGNQWSRNEPTINRVLILKAFDEDNIASNGITITPALKAALADKTINLDIAPIPAPGTSNNLPVQFTRDLNALLAALPTPYNAVARQTSVTDNNVFRVKTRESFESFISANAAHYELVGQLPNPLTTINVLTDVSTTVTTAGTRTVNTGTASNAYNTEISRYLVQAPDTVNGQFPSFGTGLTFKGMAADGAFEYYAITDRGPHGDGPRILNTGSALCPGAAAAFCETRIFPAPTYAPSVGVIRLKLTGSGAVLDTTSIKPIQAAGFSINGLPIPRGSSTAPTLGASNEVALGADLKPITNSSPANSLDTKAIAFDGTNLWVADEYGPFIAKLTPGGQIVTKYGPQVPTGAALTPVSGVLSKLPAVLSKRRATRGLEAMAFESTSNRLHAVLESPIADLSTAGAPATGIYVNPTNVPATSPVTTCTGGGTAAVPQSRDVQDYARFARWVQFDPATETSKMYAYPVNCADYANLTGNASITDMVSLGNGKFVVLEQTVTGGNIRLMLVEIGDATDINDAAFNPETSDLEKSSMAAAPFMGADYTKVKPLKKALLLNISNINTTSLVTGGNTGISVNAWTAIKAAGLSLAGSDRIVLTNDSDFGVITKQFTAANEYLNSQGITTCTVTNGALTTCGTSPNIATQSRVVNMDTLNDVNYPTVFTTFSDTKTSNAALGSTAGGDNIRLERLNRMWVIKFAKNLADYSVPQ